jgi:hypothetical protein
MNGWDWILATVTPSPDGTFTYLPDPTVTAVTPALQGYPHNGENLRLAVTGSDVHAELLTCVFSWGSAAVYHSKAMNVGKGDEATYCEIPSLLFANVSRFSTRNAVLRFLWDEEALRGAFSFSFVPKPMIASVNPSVFEENSTVVVSGEDFV